MRRELLFSFEALIEALREQGLEETYENLYPVFEYYNVIVIDWDKGIMGEFEHPSDFYDYLEALENNLEV